MDVDIVITNQPIVIDNVSGSLRCLDLERWRFGLKNVFVFGFFSRVREYWRLVLPVIKYPKSTLPTSMAGNLLFCFVMIKYDGWFFILKYREAQTYARDDGRSRGRLVFGLTGRGVSWTAQYTLSHGAWSHQGLEWHGKSLAAYLL